MARESTFENAASRSKTRYHEMTRRAVNARLCGFTNKHCDAVTKTDVIISNMHSSECLLIMYNMVVNSVRHSL